MAIVNGLKSEIISALIIVLCFIGTVLKDHIGYNFVTAIFMHGNMQHFMNNMLLFLMLSPAVEKTYGKLNYIGAFLLTAIVDYLFQTYVAHVMAIGLSGFVFALFMLNCFITDKRRGISICGIILLFIYGFKEISGVMHNDGISHSGHLIGLATGLIYAFVYNKIKQAKEDYNEEQETSGSSMFDV